MTINLEYKSAIKSQIVYGPRRSAHTVPFLDKNVVPATGAIPSVQVDAKPNGQDLADTLVAPHSS